MRVLITRKKHFLQRILLSLCSVIFIACAPAPEAVPETKQQENQSYTALVAAYQGEFENILQMLEGEQIERVEYHNGAAFHIGEVNGHPIIVFKTGIGLTNAAMTTQLALALYPIERLLFSGVAGGLDPALKKGDLSIPDRWHIYGYGAQFTEDDAQPLGYREPSFMQQRISDVNYKNLFPYPMATLREGLEQPEEMAFYQTDPDLRDAMQKVVADAELVNAHGEPATILMSSVGGSGLPFNDDADYAAFLRENWQTASVDMESGAIAQVCWSNGVPFLQIRAISDVVGNDNPNEFYEFKDVAEKNAAQLLNLLMHSGYLPE